MIEDANVRRFATNVLLATSKRSLFVPIDQQGVSSARTGPHDERPWLAGPLIGNMLCR